MSLDYCKALVEGQDAERATVVAAADAEAQAALWPLYAMNLEVARAPWASAEPLVAEMRLQWWVDALGAAAEGRPPQGHPVLVPLAEAAGERDLPGETLQALAEARRWDVWREPFEDAAAFDAYLAATAGGLMWVAARLLGAPEAAEGPVRDFGWGAGLAAFLAAVPELRARGRQPLRDTDPAAVAALARDGLDRIARARSQRRLVPRRALPALLTGWQAEGLLRAALRAPDRAVQGPLALSEFHRRGTLAWRGLTGRW